MATIAHVVTGLQIGGLERVVVNLVRGLRTTSDRLLVICLEDGGPFVAEVESFGIRVCILGKQLGMSWRTVLRLAVLFRKEKVDIVHTHNPAPHLHGVIGAILAGVPVIVHTKHGRNYPDMKGRVLLNRVLSWFTDAVVAVSDNVRDVALQIERVNPDKVRRIWNGVDVALYAPSGEGRPQKAVGRSPIIGTVARLSPEKSQETMLAAFKLVLSRIPEARLVLVGDGPSGPELRKAAVRLGVAENVDFLGMRSDVGSLLHTFDIFTLSSSTEGISMTVLEAMACALPIAATDVGGNREIIHPPLCGLVVPAGNPEALSSAYIELLMDSNRRNLMGQNARKRVVEYFSVDSMIAGYSSLYRELLAGRI